MPARSDLDNPPAFHALLRRTSRGRVLPVAAAHSIPGDRMHAYRTHTCGELRAADVGKTVRLSGWVHRKRDHGNLLFVDLRDHYGLTQCVVDTSSPLFKAVEAVRARRASSPSPARWCARTPETVNAKLPTGEIEVRIAASSRSSRRAEVAAAPGHRRRGLPRGNAPALPLPRSAPREGAPQHHAALARSSPRIRRRMIEQGFTEFQTPILTASSPGGRARLPGAGRAASRQVLRAAAGAAAVQAAADGRGLRPLFPDRALLPRRGQPRRPLARASSTSSISR